MKAMMTTDHSYINIAGWIDASCDDGPGMRSVLFFQGCSKNCPGCHNAKTHNPEYGQMYDLFHLVELIEARCPTHMITISGGEPLEQKDGLMKLLRELKKRGYNVCLYTGWRREDVPGCVLEYVDYLKVGGFIKQLHHGDLQYYGSSNQKMYHVSHGKILSEVA